MTATSFGLFRNPATGHLLSDRTAAALTSLTGHPSTSRRTRDDPLRLGCISVCLVLRMVPPKSKPPGGRSTDPADHPVGQAEYALRDVATLTKKAAAAGPSVGIYAQRLLDVPLPWTSMRAVYRLLGLTRSYGTAAVDAACARALELDVVDVRKIARMLEQASERQPAPSAAKVMGGAARFARDNIDYRAGRS